MAPDTNFNLRLGEIVAFRIWRTQHIHKGNYELYSPNHSSLWKPGEHFHAKCGHNFSPPNLECSCGIYAKYSWESLVDEFRTQLDHPKVIVGEIYLWGQVLSYSEGYRAEHAYPKSFFYLPSHDPAMIDKLAIAWDVEVKKAPGYYRRILSISLEVSHKQYDLVQQALRAQRRKLQGPVHYHIGKATPIPGADCEECK